jgi:uncharacterized membrane protein YeaQ/YmgE (transglycosylase-associated protein family)
MGILIGIVFGLAAGAVAKIVMPGPDPAGFGGSLVLGMAGGLIGGVLGTVLTGANWIAFDGRGLVLAMIGALFALLSYRSYAMRAMA